VFSIVYKVCLALKLLSAKIVIQVLCLPLEWKSEWSDKESEPLSTEPLKYLFGVPILED